MFIYFWETERQCANRGGAEKETESEAGSRLWAVSTEPNTGLELTNRKTMTWADIGRITNWATQVPCAGLFYSILWIMFNIQYLWDSSVFQAVAAVHSLSKHAKHISPFHVWWSFGSLLLFGFCQWCHDEHSDRVSRYIRAPISIGHIPRDELGSEAMWEGVLFSR